MSISDLVSELSNYASLIEFPAAIVIAAPIYSEWARKMVKSARYFIPGILGICFLLEIADVTARAGWLTANDGQYIPISNHLKTQVYGQTFMDERVVVDGKSFQNCTFVNVTLVYNGTGNFDFINDNFEGVVLASDFESIEGAFQLEDAITKLVGTPLSVLKNAH